MEETVATLSKQVWWLGVVLLILIAAVSHWFFRYFTRAMEARLVRWLDRLWEEQVPQPKDLTLVISTASNLYAESLQRGNEFFFAYGQLLIAILIIIVLAVLLLTRTISAEAGLPILSAVAGYAIAKGPVAVRSAGRGSEPIRGRGPEERF